MNWSMRMGVIPLLALTLVACDDVSPVDYRPVAEDADIPDADPEQIAACRECMRGDQGACRPAYDQCRADHSLCDPLGTCFTDNDCWRQLDLANIADLPECMLSCYREVGLTSVNDIASAATPVFICLMTDPSCSFACFGIGEPPEGGEDAGH